MNHRSLRTTLLVWLPGAALLGACYVGAIEKDSPAGTTGRGGSDPARDERASEPGGASGAGARASGLPCDVAEVITKYCGSCHGTPPSAPMALTKRSDFFKNGANGRPYAELVVTRMKDLTRPMPPASMPQPSADERALITAWVVGGLVEGTCGEPEPPPTTSSDSGVTTPPPNVACSSGKRWSGRPSALMNPGRACITCHESADDDGPIVQIGGTVYPTFHEEDMCLGVDGTTTTADVVITDARNKTFTLPVNASGNFAWFVGQEAISFPIRAKVVSGGRERAMATPQMTGDCNSCHTQGGANGAPGRIALP